MKQVAFLDKSFHAPNVWFTSDLHFGHKKIIEYCKRPFENINEMNQGLVDNWNKVVGKDDVVFNLGDVVFGNRESWDKYVKQLNGHHFLLFGNHDPVKWEPYMEGCIEGAYPFLKIKIDSQAIYLGHFPLLVYDGSNTGKIWNLHGHTHLNPRTTGVDTERMKLRTDWQLDVGCDGWDYTPVNYDKIKQIMDEKTLRYRNLEEMRLDYQTNTEAWV